MKKAFTFVSSAVPDDGSMPVSPGQPAIAHVLRRLTLGPTPGAIESLSETTPSELIRQLLDAAPLLVDPPELTEDNEFDLPTSWWVSTMRHSDSGLHERMVWYWHGHLTSSIEKSSGWMIVDQHMLLRRHALGNFREMLREITLDPAMLCWLDGSESDAEAPNENYARELMELFALGRDSGAYTEADVAAGAKALAGYWVNEGNDNKVEFESDGALSQPVQFLGRLAQNVVEVIDIVCDHPACARHIARRLHIEFVGAEPTPERLDQLAFVFRDNDLELLPLVEAIVTDSGFFDDAVPRHRSALEWFLAFERLVDAELDTWIMEQMGQIPFYPPNVAGWPDPQRWASSGQLLAKAQTALNESRNTEVLDADDPVGDLLRRACLPEISTETRAVLDQIVASTPHRLELSDLLHATIALSPEFSQA